MNALIVGSLFALLFLLALPNIAQLISCFRETPRESESDRAKADPAALQDMRFAQSALPWQSARLSGLQFRRAGRLKQSWEPAVSCASSLYKKSEPVQ